MEYSALIITALFDELCWLHEVTDDLNWQEDKDSAGFPYHYATLDSDSKRPLRIAAAWAGEMGETAAADRSRSLIAHLNPRCLAMCGICAGRRGDVFLGDVIVANRVFSYDHGKVIASIDEESKIRREDWLHDIETYDLKKRWAMEATYLSKDPALVPSFVDERPVSMEYQRRWLLNALYQHEHFDKPPPGEPARSQDRLPQLA